MTTTHWHVIHHLPRFHVLDRVSPVFATEEEAWAGLRVYPGGGPGTIRLVEETTDGVCWDGTGGWIDFAHDQPVPGLPRSLGNVRPVRVSHP